MHKLVLLIRNSLHKSRGQMASLLIIVILSGLMMNIGALTLFDFGVFFDEKIEQTHTPHLSFLIQKDRYRPADEGFLRMDTHVTETRTEEVLFLTNGSFAYGDGHLSLGMVFQNMDVYREMAPISLIGDADLTLKNGIYAPYLLHAGSGYEVGDVFSVESDHRQYDFQIAGFVEDVMFGGMNTGMIGFFVPDALYQRLRAAGSATPAVYLTAKLDDISFSEEVMNGYVAAIDDSSGLMWAMSALIAKYARMIVPNIVSMVIAAFSVIITVIALVVIRFRINDSIRDDIKDIGVLKSLGYVTSQINASILLLFLCITAVGSVLGIGLSYLLVPLISGAFSAQTGLIWVQGFSPQTSILCLLVMLSTVALNASYCLRRVKDLHPIAAIRGDGDARGFKRNYFRLDESAWGLQFSLACKQIMQNLGQNVMIALITAAVTFASAFGLIFYNNMAVDSDSFIMTIAGELCSAAVAPISNQYTARMVSEINGMPEVRKAIAFDDITTFVSDEPIMTSVTEDFDDLDGQMLYEGNYPRSAGEVAIGGNLAASEGKTIGDTIEIRGWKDKAEYRISGFIQSGNNMGRTLAMTAEGVKRILPEYLPTGIYIYLEEGERADAFIELLERRYGSVIYQPINVDSLIEGEVGSYVTIVSLMAGVILLITGFVVAMIVYFVIKTVIARRRQAFGIQKALGFTTVQLVQQISLGILPVVTIGSIAGVAAGYFWICPMLTALFRSVGIMRFDLAIAHLWMVLLCVGMVAFTYIVTLCVSVRIRKISAYALVTE